MAATLSARHAQAPRGVLFAARESVSDVDRPARGVQVTRRQILGATLSASIASAVLPWDSLVEWFRAWFGDVVRNGADQLATFSRMMKEVYSEDRIEELLYAPSPFMQMLERRA